MSYKDEPRDSLQTLGRIALNLRNKRRDFGGKVQSTTVQIRRVPSRFQYNNMDLGEN